MNDKPKAPNTKALEGDALQFHTEVLEKQRGRHFLERAVLKFAQENPDAFRKFVEQQLDNKMVSNHFKDGVEAYIDDLLSGKGITNNIT